MPYTKLKAGRGTAARCDGCQYAVGSGCTSKKKFIDWFKSEHGWRFWQRRGEGNKAWCSKQECRIAADAFIEADKKQRAEERKALKKGTKRHAA